MIKKILSLTVAILLLSVTVLASVSNTIILAQASEAVTGETKTYVLFAAPNGVYPGKGITTGLDEIYESARYYSSDTSDGGNSTANTSSPYSFAIGTGTADGGDAYFAGLFRFPIELLNIPANENVTEAQLKLTSRYNKTYSVGDGYDIKVYGGFTNAALGENIPLDGDKTYAQITATEALAGETTVKSDLTTNTAVTIPVTKYVSALVSNGADSIDLAVAAPTETTQIYFQSGASNTGAGNVDINKHAPMLIITTEVDLNYGLPAIDTVANEGKTKIRMQTTDTAFSNTSCGIYTTNKGTITYNVNAKTAGKYYFSAYSLTNQFNRTTLVTGKPGTLTVNDVKVSDDNAWKVSQMGDSTKSVAEHTPINNYLYRTVYEIDLNKGANTIAVYKGTSGQFGIAYVELTNYARTEPTETRTIAEKGIEIPVAVQPTETVMPTVVYKVYDSIAAANASRGNVVMELAGGTESYNGDCYYIAASYDSNHVMQDVELLSFPHYRMTSRVVDMGEFSFEGISYINVFAFDGTTLAPVANFGTIN